MRNTSEIRKVSFPKISAETRQNTTYFASQIITFALTKPQPARQRPFSPLSLHHLRPLCQFSYNYSSQIISVAVTQK